MLSDRTIEILESNDIKVYDRKEQNGKYYREIEFYSSEGEDVVETIWYDGTDEGFIKGFRDNAENFDADEHAEMWIEHRHIGRGIPQSIWDLINDAQWIKDILLEVAAELEEDEEIENLTTMNKNQFIDYINKNFSISGEAGRLIYNILTYVEDKGLSENEQYLLLSDLLDNTIGLSDNELKKVCL